MKWLFSGLLLANVGMWMWGNWYVTDSVVPAALEARPEIAPEKMRLLSEADTATMQARIQTAPQTTALTDVSPPRTCYRIGPFEKETSLKPVRQWLADYVVSAAPSESEQEVTSYRVYIKPLASTQEVATMRSRLSRAGFRDHALIYESGMKNAISLGVFTVKKNAAAHMRRLEKKGFKVSRQTLVRYQKHYFIDIKSEKDLKPVLARRNWDQARAEEVACKPAAAAKQG